MKIKSIFLILILILAFSDIFLALEKGKDEYKFPLLSGPYLGQNPPGSTPQVFASGIISFGFHEIRITFSPEGDEAFYVMTDIGYKHRNLIHIKMNNKKWSEPELAWFAGKHINSSPCFSPDGKRVYFASNRAYSYTVGGSKFDIWYIEKKNGNWSDPIKLPNMINSDKRETSPSAAANGNLYFTVSGEERKPFIYYSEYKNGKYLPREKLKIDVKEDAEIGSPFIAPDESYLLFQAIFEEGYGGNDIYISFRNEDDSWKSPINLGKGINTEYNDFGARVSFDGKYLFFSSYREYDVEELRGKSYRELMKLYKSPKNGYATLYWVDASFLNKLKSENYSAN